MLGLGGCRRKVKVIEVDLKLLSQCSDHSVNLCHPLPNVQCVF